MYLERKGGMEMKKMSWIRMVYGETIRMAWIGVWPVLAIGLDLVIFVCMWGLRFWIIPAEWSLRMQAVAVVGTWWLAPAILLIVLDCVYTPLRFAERPEERLLVLEVHFRDIVVRSTFWFVTLVTDLEW